MLANFDPDEIVKKFDEFEQNLDQVLDNTINKVDSAAEKIQNTADVVEKKLEPNNTASASGTDDDNDTDR